MSIYTIPQDVLDSLTEEAKGKLEAYTPEDVTGLKENANKILAEKKELEAKYAQAIADAKKTKVAKDPKVEDLQSMFEDLKGKYDATLGELDSIKEQSRENALMSKARELAATLAPSDQRRSELLAKEIRQRLQLDGESSTVVLSKDGKPTISSLSDLTNEVKQDYDFLCDGTNSTGGGAKGGGGGAAKSNEMKRSDFNSLDQKGRADFAKSGGKVIAD